MNHNDLNSMQDQSNEEQENKDKIEKNKKKEIGRPSRRNHVRTVTNQFLNKKYKSNVSFYALCI